MSGFVYLLSWLWMTGLNWGANFNSYGLLGKDCRQIDFTLNKIHFISDTMETMNTGSKWYIGMELSTECTT